MKKFLCLCACVSLFGCAHESTAPPPHSTVPRARRFETSLFKPSRTRNCAVTIVREPGVPGSGLNLSLDGEGLARIASGETITVYLKPGRHRLTARPLFSPVVTKRLFLQKGERTTIRVLDRDGNFELRIVDRGSLAAIGQAYHSLVHKL